LTGFYLTKLIKICKVTNKFQNPKGAVMKKPILIFLLALPLLGQKPTIVQRVQAQAVLGVGMATEQIAPRMAAQTEDSQLLIQPILSADPLVVKRQEGNGIKTGTKIRLPPLKGIAVEAWYLTDKVGKQVGVTFRF
jgi:hypothetical protein